MTKQELKKLLASKDYETLAYLAQDLIESLTLGGSFAYGLETETSDLDLRGFCLRPRRSILLGNDFEQVQVRSIDTTLYTYSKFLRLLTAANPSVLEWLGLDKEAIIYEGWAAKLIRKNAQLFVTKRVAATFGGYAKQQSRKLEQGILENAMQDRPKKASKYMSHLIRLYHMGAEILRGEGIKTKRDSDRDLLIAIKRGEYLKKGTEVFPNDAFYELMRKARLDFMRAEEESKLPEKPDIDAINNIQLQIAEAIVCEGYSGKTLKEIVTS